MHAYPDNTALLEHTVIRAVFVIMNRTAAAS
jgi:hypothetical protein